MFFLRRKLVILLAIEIHYEMDGREISMGGICHSGRKGDTGSSQGCNKTCFPELPETPIPGAHRSLDPRESPGLFL